MRNISKLFLISAVLVLTAPQAAASELSKKVDGIINRPSEKKVQYGIHVIRAATGKSIYSHNEDKLLIPASNMKIIATAAAMKYLGPDYAYQTIAGLSQNTLVIIGSGDPLLADAATDAKYGRRPGWFLNEISDALKKQNIRFINDILIDTTIFDDQRTHPSWPAAELNRWYACEISGLNYNDNCVDVTVTNNSGSISITVDPPSRFLKIINQITPKASGTGAVGCYRTNELNTLIAKGTCVKQQGPFPVAIERPSAFLAFLLTEHLREQGIEVQGNFIEQAFIPNSDFQILTSHKTPLSDCLDRSNKNSFGLAAEALFKTIAASKNGNKNGSWPDAQKLVADYLVSLRIPPEHFVIDDGSGLSRNNKLTASAITTVLLDQYKSNNWQMYKDSLAIGGVDGTIRRYFDKSPYKGNIRGKTGYISSVKSFSGVCTSDGKDYIFAILTNNADGRTRAAINDIAQAVVDLAK